MALSLKEISVEKKNLHVPVLEELVKVFNSRLVKNFADVTVEVVNCPDLTQKPFTLANKGLGGDPKLIEVGGVPYLIPLVDRSKVYDLQDLAKLSKADPAFIIGAGAGPFPYIGVNCEGIINLNLANGTVNQQTRVSKVAGADEHCEDCILPSTETRIAVLGNFFVSEGKSGKVIKVHVRNRIGQENFIECLRKSLEKHYSKDQLVGIGGTFLIADGKVKQHVMRDFSKTPLNTDEQMNDWLKFYTMSAPLVAVGTFVSNDGDDLDLRVQHFHSFSDHGEAGHYHIDTTPNTVEYIGYFAVAKELYRLDKPVVTHKVITKCSKNMGKKFMYFAYGSNLLSHRIHINNPSAERKGIGKLKDYELSFVTFSKRWGGCSATIAPKKTAAVWGALWEIDEMHKEALDRQEGVPNKLYIPLSIEIELSDGKKSICRTYQQTAKPPNINSLSELPKDYRPSVPYLHTIIKGAEESGLPSEYLEFLNQIPHNGFHGPVDINLPLNIQHVKI